ncbi:MAG: ATP-dependent helicase [Spirochaetaceae bacterium]|jgi:DNA helicase-2/ATP-dependent DNA helicase PcrA|nr:ATP-dependent helicase [Spirochaetaceae bacterium]
MSNKHSDPGNELFTLPLDETPLFSQNTSHFERVPDDYLSALNERQREAVFHGGRPLLILAGAGSGKTRVITTKIAYFIREKNINPWSILAVTFTNKAAKEMAARAALIEPRASHSILKTFHSFGAWFLRRNGDYAHLKSNFVIYDDHDSVALLSSLLPNRRKEDLNKFAYQISKAKDMNLSPESDGLELINPGKEFREIYADYEERLREIGNVDFGDLIKKPIELLKNNPELKARIHDRFRVVMVDEYQDANVAQALLLRELVGPESYLCVVGDDDQSIYRFRGAEVRNILEFPTMFGGADIIKLEKNYRSTSYILDLADSVIRNNQGRHGKKLVSARGLGKMPQLGFLPDAEREASCSADLIVNSVQNGGKQRARYADWAILYRTNAQSLNFENEFLRRKIPYKIIGSLKFYEREEIKDSLALLSFMVNPKDEVSFSRVINKPARGIGEVTLERILAERWNDPDRNIEAAIKRLLPSLGAKAKSGVEEFLAALSAGRAALDPEDGGGVAESGRINSSGADLEQTNGPQFMRPDGDRGGGVEDRPTIADDMKVQKKKSAPPLHNKSILKAADGLSLCVGSLIEAAGIARFHLTRDEVNGETRAANLQELVNSAALYPANESGLVDFLERIELDRSLSENDPGGDYVTLITLHNTKGLEFKRVIMTGLEQGLFPRGDKSSDDLEEERRLFYVGATRAMDELYLTSCATRRMWGQSAFMNPSLFLLEADKSKLDISGKIPKSFYIADQKGTIAVPSWARSIKKTSSDGRWQIGDMVFNDDYGYGELIGIQEGDDGPVITVHFETGSETKFLSRSQSKKFLKITA